MAKDMRKAIEWRKAERAYNQIHASSVFSIMGLEPVHKPEVDNLDRELEELLEECPNYYPALFQRAELMLRAGRSDEGEDLLSKAFNCLSDTVADETEFRNTLIQRMENLGKLLRYDLAVHYLEKAIHKYPGIALFYDYLAFYTLLPPKSNSKRALEFQKKALDMEPGNSNFMENLGWTYMVMGDYKEAERYLKIAVSRNPQDKSHADTLNTCEYIIKHQLDYYTYFLRPADKEFLTHLANDGKVEELTLLCKKYNNDRLEAFVFQHLRANSMQPHEILNIIQPFKTFMTAVEDVAGDDIFLYENVDMLLNELKYFFYQFLVRYDHIDEAYIETVYHSICIIYKFFRETNLVNENSYNRLIERLKPLKKEFAEKIEEYYRIRYDVSLTEEKKEHHIEKLLGI